MQLNSESVLKGAERAPNRDGRRVDLDLLQV